MKTDRIQQKFKELRQRRQTGLVVFVTAGCPDKEATLELVPELVAALGEPVRAALGAAGARAGCV